MKAGNILLLIFLYLITYNQSKPANTTSPCDLTSLHLIGQASSILSLSARISGVGTKISLKAYAIGANFMNNMRCYMHALGPYPSKTIPNIADIK